MQRFAVKSEVCLAAGRRSIWGVRTVNCGASSMKSRTACPDEFRYARVFQLIAKNNPKN
jgi:hypothetical protein